MKDLPIVRRIGDIIRIHRAEVYFKFFEFLIMNVNVFHKSSWSIYSADKRSPLGYLFKNKPYSFSEKKPIDGSYELKI